MAILSYKNKQIENLKPGIIDKKTRKLLPPELHRSAIKKFAILNAATNLNDIANFPGLTLEKLKGERYEEYSIRINRQYRICFKWNGRDVYDVNILLTI